MRAILNWLMPFASKSRRQLGTPKPAVFYSTTIAQRLSLLVAGVLVLMIAGTVLVIGRYVRDEQLATVRVLQLSARGLARAISGELERQQAALVALSTSQALANDDLRGFYEQMKAFVAGTTEQYIIVYGPSAEIMVHSGVPFGTQASRNPLALEYVREAVVAKKPVVSNFFTGATLKKQIVTLNIPVIRDGHVPYVLAFSSVPLRFQEIIGSQRMPQDWLAVVFDRTGRTIARSERFRETLGEMQPDDLVAATRHANEGVVDVRDLDGVHVRAAFIKLPLSGWTVVAGIPISALNAPFTGAAKLGGITISGATVLALVFALWYGRKSARPIVALRDMAAALGRGERPSAVKLALREAQLVADQLQTTGTILDEQRRDNEALRASLEERVAQRTQELAEKRAEADAIGQRYRNLVETMNDGLLVVDADVHITFVNPQFARMLSYIEADLLGHQTIEFLDESSRASIPAAVERCKQGIAERYELTWIDRDGRPVPTLISVRPNFDARGVYAGSLSVVTDLSEIKRTEAKLRETEKRYWLLFEVSRDAVMSLAPPTWKFITANRAALEMFGAATLADFTALGPWEVSPEFQADGQSSHDKALAMIAQAARQGHNLFEWEHRRLNGECFWTEVLLTRIDSGAQILLYATVRDITARKKAELEVRRLNTELEERVIKRTAALDAANKELETFAYSVSHDLRAPLRAVDGFSQILLDDYGDKLDEEGKRLLGVVRAGTVKMSQLIDDILAFSRAGRTEMSRENVDMEALVRSTLAEELAPALAGRAIAIDVGKLPAAEGDRAMLERVWANLLGNAIKFTAPKPDARIEIGAGSGEAETTYYVRDNGVGFDMKYAEKLFGVFQRLHGAEFPGTGIGLAIVKRIVGRHGGRVWAESKPGEGATFYFSLPAKEASHA